MSVGAAPSRKKKAGNGGGFCFQNVLVVTKRMKNKKKRRRKKGMIEAARIEGFKVVDILKQGKFKRNDIVPFN